MLDPRVTRLHDRYRPHYRHRRCRRLHHHCCLLPARMTEKSCTQTLKHEHTQNTKLLFFREHFNSIRSRVNIDSDYDVARPPSWPSLFHSFSTNQSSFVFCSLYLNLLR